MRKTMPTPKISDPSTIREDYLPVPGARLYVREIGEGPPLLILHGGPDFNHNYLLPEMDRLSSAFRLIYYDQRGRGKSSGTAVPEDVDIDSETEDLDRIRQHFGVGAISILGHSWGGLLAMEYATRYPDRIARLVLMNTAPASYADRVRFQEHRLRNEADNLTTMRAIAKTRQYAEGDIGTEVRYYRAHYGTTIRLPEHLASLVARLRSHFTPETTLTARAIEERLYAQTWRSPDYDLIPKLRQLKAPTLVIHSERDFVPLECATNIAQAVPGARLVVLKECGHFAYMERPGEVLRALTDFFIPETPTSSP
jgi:proline iminopeptidase